MRSAYCKERVYTGDSYSGYQCSRKAKIDGYCKQHHPDAVAERKAATDARYAVESAVRRRGWARKAAEADLMEAIVRDYPSSPKLAEAIGPEAQAAVEKYIENVEPDDEL